MRRIFLIVGLTSALALPVAVAPVTAVAKPKGAKGVKQIKNTLKTQGQSLSVLSTQLTNLKTTVGTISGTVATLVSGGQQIQGALTTIQGVLTTLGNGLTTVGNGLTTLSNAVSNTTTGLPGLNAARNLVGAVVSDAAVSGSEFSVKAHTAGAPAGPNHSWVLSFVNGVGTAADVSKRVFEVTMANPGQLGAAPTIFSAVDCASAATLCGAVVGSADSSPTDVVVSSSAGDKDFQIAALTG